jgi:hypothetical protein
MCLGHDVFALAKDVMLNQIHRPRISSISRDCIRWTQPLAKTTIPAIVGIATARAHGKMDPPFQIND